VEVVQTAINALVVGAVGVALARMTQNLRQELKAEIAELRVEVRGEIGAFRADVKGEMGDLRSELREVRSDLTRVALAVGSERRAGHQ